MENEINKIAADTKDTVAASADAWKSFQERADFSGKAREFVKRTTDTAKERAADLNAGMEKANTAIETALIGSIGEAAKFNREVQQAMYQDAETFFASVDKLASAKTFGEAFQVQSDFWRERSETAALRAKSASDYVGKLLADSAKSVQDNLSKVVPFSRKAA